MYYYGMYYSTLAMFLRGGEEWIRFYSVVRDEIIAKQNDDGHFNGESGDAEGTAFALLVLQLPNRLLPIYSGTGHSN